jgi:hypothetical protein
MVLLGLALSSSRAAQDDAKVQVDLATQDDSWSVPADLTLRARVTAITPQEPVNIDWRYGGEGMGGQVSKGTLAEKLDIGVWSPPLRVAPLVKGKFPGKLFVTFTTGRGGKLARDKQYGYHHMEGHSTGVDMEFEFGWNGKVIKTFTESGPDGGTIGLVIPAYRLAGGKTPESPEFLSELTGLLEYAHQRAARLQKLPWAGSAGVPAGWFPKRFSIVTDIHGYGTGMYYGTRYTNKSVMEAECTSLRLLGVNSLAGAPLFLQEMAGARKGFGKDFARGIYLQLGGYPVPSAPKGKTVPEAGCPFAPGVAARTKEMIDAGLPQALKLPFDEVFWRTEDEIGSVFDRAPEGKQHAAVCPLCAEGFRAYVKAQGRAPSDFGKADWPEVKPIDIFGKQPAAITDPGTALAAYSTSMFVNYASASLFTPVRDAIAQANKETQQAPDKRRPLIYSFALRGNTFLMGGHSLDFFDFYRLADNAFVYETSNRDARVWSWDSYLCDVGRVVSNQQELKLGIYVKPHRGAVIQRTLSAVSRGAQMIYWYTYGPDYVKGDSFAEKDEALEKTSRAAWLLGKAEEVLYGSAWAIPAQVAVVNPRSSEIWAKLRATAGLPSSAASYENAKWIYTALAHAHIPVDAIDEGMLATQDLTRYKAIYISGQNLTRAAATKVTDWVKAGGTLYTSGGGLARDEADQPLVALQPILGLEGRNAPEMWYTVSAYGATTLEPYDDARKSITPVPAGAEISAAAPTEAKFKPRIGREVLKPAAGTEVLAKFADGGAALTRFACGKGRVFVAGFFPGLEYSAPLRSENYDMSKDFDASLRRLIAWPAAENAPAIVDASVATVEGVLLKNEASGKRAVTLMNWTYRVSGKRGGGKNVVSLVPLKNLAVTLRCGGKVQKLTSVMLNAQLPCHSEEAGVYNFTLPELNEGDVLLLE